MESSDVEKDVNMILFVKNVFIIYNLYILNFFKGFIEGV